MTSGTIGAGQLSLTKSIAILINTSRDATVNEAALANGTIAAARLDSALTRMEDVILSNHLAWHTKESAAELATKAERNISERRRWDVERAPARDRHWFTTSSTPSVRRLSTDAARSRAYASGVQSCVPVPNSCIVGR